MYDLKSNGSCDLTRLYDNLYDDKTLLDTLKLTIKCWRSSDKVYKILKYDKKLVSNFECFFKILELISVKNLKEINIIRNKTGIKLTEIRILYILYPLIKILVNGAFGSMWCALANFGAFFYLYKYRKI